MANETRIHLVPTQFTEYERPVVSYGSLRASMFRYRSGVCALKMQNRAGEIIILPFQGQQIWSATFALTGTEMHAMTMRSMFDEPRPTRNFLETFGGFLQHCGATAIGTPGPGDSHPLHGELPNAPYPAAFIVTGEEEWGPYIGVGGSYRHTVAFGYNYVAQPLVKVYEDSTLFNVSMTITNEMRSPMELMYLAHVNFRPVDGGKLYYTAVPTPSHVRVRTSIPSHIRPGPGYREFLEKLRHNPELHETLSPDLPMDPEVVLFIDYIADEDGWAHSMQVHPDGHADYLRHRPAELPRGTRWISRTPDQDAIALVEPGTCEPEGYHREKEKGNILLLEAGERFHMSLDIGILTPEAAQQRVTHIRNIVSRHSAG